MEFSNANSLPLLLLPLQEHSDPTFYLETLLLLLLLLLPLFD